jgi:hypothetical protein
MVTSWQLAPEPGDTLRINVKFVRCQSYFNNPGELIAGMLRLQLFNMASVTWQRLVSVHRSIEPMRGGQILRTAAVLFW